MNNFNAPQPSPQPSEMPPERADAIFYLLAKQHGASFVSQWPAQAVRLNAAAADLADDADALVDEMAADAGAMLVSIQPMVQEVGLTTTLAILRDTIDNFAQRWHALLGAWSMRQVEQWQQVLRDEVVCDILALPAAQAHLPSPPAADQPSAQVQQQQQQWVRQMLTGSVTRAPAEDPTRDR